MAVMINETEWQKMKKERAELQEEKDAAVAKLDAIVREAPECWGDDPDPVAFVDSLLNRSSTMPGHTETCDCWG